MGFMKILHITDEAYTPSAGAIGDPAFAADSGGNHKLSDEQINSVRGAEVARATASRSDLQSA
jgi:hypothetical protein